MIRIARNTLSAIVVATLFGAVAPTTYAALPSYIYVPLDRSGAQYITIDGVDNGYVVGNGSLGSNTGLLWNLSNGQRTVLSVNGFGYSASRGISSGKAFGEVGTTGFDSKPVVWDVSTGQSTFLDSTGYNYIMARGAGGGYGLGEAYTATGSRAAAWNLTTGAQVFLDQTGIQGGSAQSANGGYIAGNYFDSTLGTTRATAWDAANGARISLDVAGFAASDTYGVTNGQAVGYVYDGLNYRACVWNLTTGVRTDLSFLPGNNSSTAAAAGNGFAAGATYQTPTVWELATNTAYNMSSYVNKVAASLTAVDAQSGLLAGATTDSSGYGQNAVPFALTPFASGSPVAVAAGQTATTSAPVSQNSGNIAINGSFQFTNAGTTYTLGGGTLSGAGSLTGNLSVGGGTLAPGNSPGTFTVTGNYSMSDGIYAIEIAGTGAGQFDVLNVTGSATFTGGAFSITTLNGFAPTVGQFFNVVTTGTGISGAPNVATPAGWTFTQSGNNGRLTFVGVATVVPEAGTGLLTLLATPAFGLVTFRRLRKSRQRL